MSSIVTAVFKATIGLIVNKGRDKAAERLREGDITEQKFRSAIVREIDDIKSKLDGLSKKDLLVSISFFEEGIELLYEVFDKARCRSEGGEVPVRAASAEVFALAEGMKNVELTGLDESATRALANAKGRFKDARREATRAFKNEALTTSDRMLAMEYRVMATILETVDNPADAMAPCRVCIKELNCLSAVRQSFNVELRKGKMAMFGKDERREFIASVCHVNRVFYDVQKAVGKEEPFWMWPTVDTVEGNIDPLRNRRIVEVLDKQGIEHCVTSWSFGQEGVQRLEIPSSMAMNSKGQFIIAERENRKVKVFDRRGQFMEHFSLPVHNVDQVRLSKMGAVAVDMNDNIYVLAKLYNHRRQHINESGFEPVVYTCNTTGEVHHKFSLKEDVYWYDRDPVMLVDSKHKVLIMSEGTLTSCVDVYENDGQFLRGFEVGQGLGLDMALTSDDHVLVLTEHARVLMYSEHGVLLSEFKLSFTAHRIASHHSSEHVVAATEDEHGDLWLHIYTKDGELVRSTKTNAKLGRCRKIIVTADGHVALLSGENPWRVFIVC